MEKKYSKISIIFVILANALLLVKEIFRYVWFDEALTIFLINQRDSIGEIYQNYIIPNNQIVYSSLLYLWNKFYIFNIPYDYYLRLFGVIISIIILIYFAMRFKRIFHNHIIGYLIIINILTSLSFAIYAGSIRGYQLSMLWLLIVVDLQYLIVDKLNIRRILGYLIFSMLAVGTIPTNLLGLGMGVILVAPKLVNDKDWLKKLIALGVVPFVALILFYLPIFSKFLAVCKLGEGIEDRFNVYFVVLLSFFSSALVLTLLAIVGFVKSYKDKGLTKLEITSYILLFLVPIIPCLVFAKAPFYRVFYPSFIIWYIVLAIGVANFYKAYMSSIDNKKIVCYILGIVMLIFANTSIIKFTKLPECISNQLVKAQDDLFSPYYLDDDFSPIKVLNYLEESKVKGDIVYFSFDSDPIAFQYYLAMNNYSFAPKFRCNVGSNNLVKALNQNDLIVVKKGEIVTKNIEKVDKVAEVAMWEIYKVKEILDDFIR